MTGHARVNPIRLAAFGITPTKALEDLESFLKPHPGQRSALRLPLTSGHEAHSVSALRGEKRRWNAGTKRKGPTARAPRGWEMKSLCGGQLGSSILTVADVKDNNRRQVARV